MPGVAGFKKVRVLSREIRRPIEEDNTRILVVMGTVLLVLIVVFGVSMLLWS